ncbi:MAG TPA: DUF4439 domain-containing protein [Ornithinibacter sp.]|nr:DUF4439 domain-containing protein [Ornithinibacter sp.]
MRQAAREGVTRRTFVAGALGALALSASGCGIRLEDDAPRVPLVPTRTPVPAEAELVALTADTLALAELAATVPGPLAAALTTIHRRQHTVLRTTLLRQQVPVALLDAPPTSTGTTVGASTSAPASTSPSAIPSPSPSPSPSPTVSALDLADAEGRAAAKAGEFAGAEADLLATLASLHAQRYAAATLLSGRPPTVPTDPVAGAAVEALAASTSAAVYLFEVVSARSDGAQRTRSDATLDVLRRLRADQVAGGSAPEDSIGHPLPFAVTTSADAARLAREVVFSLRAGYGEHLGALAASEDGGGLEAATRWLGTVEVQAQRWGVSLVPFPGLE